MKQALQLLLGLFPVLLDTGVQVVIEINQKLPLFSPFYHLVLMRSECDQVWNSVEINEMIRDPNSGFSYEEGLLFGASPNIYPSDGSFAIRQISLSVIF